MGGPSLADRQKGGNMAQVQQRSLSGADKAASTEGLKMHYEYPEETGYLASHYYYYDPTLDIIFFRGVLCGNLVPIEEVPKKIAAAMKDVESNGVEALSYASHEQYTFPSYPNYIPDHLDRLALAARLFKENGFTPVFFNDGILGNTAWE